MRSKIPHRHSLPVSRWIAFILLILFLLVLCSVPVVGASGRQVIYYHGNDATAKKIAFTFDDGPHPSYTEKILEILDSYQIKATFFFIGQNVEYYPEIAKKVVNAGHEIGNHTYSHPPFRNTTSAMLAQEIRKTDAVLKKIGCDHVTLFRPPQGFYGSDFPVLLQDTGKTAILWSVDPKDWAHPSSMEIIRHVEDHSSGGDIILFHDFVNGESQTIPALKKLIPALLARGYQFVTVSELIYGEEGSPASG